MQTIIISGNLAQDCEVLQNKDGGENIKFTVAVRDGRSQEEKPTYYSCRMKKTGVTDYLTKGRFVTVMGPLRVSTNVKDDKTYVNLDVWANSLDLAPLPKEN
mgnify:CR=1 FL=1